MPEYRPARAEEALEVRAIHGHAFDPWSGPRREPPDDEEDWPPEYAEPRVLAEDGDIRSVCVLYRLEASVRGEWTTIGGIGGVATPPEHRREGHARELLAEALREYRADGVDYVALWPFETGFYRGLGWGTTNEYVRYDAPPAELAAAARGDRWPSGTIGPDAGEPDAGGANGGDTEGVDASDRRMREIDADDWRRLRPVEEARARGVGLSLRRSEAWWRDRTLGSGYADAPPFAYACERDGDVVGYVLYRAREGSQEGSRSDRRLEVLHFAPTDPSAERSLLAFLGDHDSQVETVRLWRADGGALLRRFPRPGEVECTLFQGAMVRVTDAARALADHRWPDGLEASLTVHVSDPLLEDGDATVRVDVADGAASVERVDGGTSTATTPEAAQAADAADASVDVGALSQLLVGARTVEQVEDVDGIVVPDADTHSVLRAAFPGERVELDEFF